MIPRRPRDHHRRAYRALREVVAFMTPPAGTAASRLEPAALRRRLTLLIAVVAGLAVANVCYAQPLDAISRNMKLHNGAPMIHYGTTQIDGLSIFFREAGSREKPTILLLHGFPASSFMFRDLMANLANDFHLIAPDYPGFGLSDAPPREKFTYTFDKVAEVTGKFADQQGLKKYALYMQDFGGPVGFRLASRRPEQISFLIVQNANAYDEGLPDSFWAPARTLWANPSQENRQMVREAAISDDALVWNYTHGVNDVSLISPDSWILQRAFLNRPGNKEIMVDLLYDYRTNPPLYSQWHEYFRQHQPPTLIVWGKNDIIFPESGAHPYLRDLRNVDFNLLDTGHFALEDHAEVIAAHIRRFAKSLPQ